MPFKERGSYEPSRQYLCTDENVPQALQGLRKQMIVKMASAFGLPVSKDQRPVAHQTLCQQVDNAIRKAKLMQQLEGIGETCVRGVAKLKEELLLLGNDRQDAQVEQAVNQLQLASNMEKIQDMFEDPTVSADDFEKVVAAIKVCNQQVDQVSNSIRATLARRSKPLPIPPPAPKTKAVVASSRRPASAKAPSTTLSSLPPPPPYTDTRVRATSVGSAKKQSQSVAERITSATERAQGYAETGQAVVNALSQIVAIGRNLSNAVKK